MKTAISIPDAIFDDAERFAEERGLSRSELYAKAVSNYIKAERFQGVRERLDAVYRSSAEESKLAVGLADAQLRSLPKERW